MSGLKKISIIDAFHRGTWLAAELASQGMDVNWLDCTDAMGPWAAEDREGPFAIFDDEEIAGSQREFLFLPGLIEKCTNGMTLRLASQPLEFRGPFFRDNIKKYGLSNELIDLLKGKLGATRPKTYEMSEKILGLAHQYASTRSVPGINAKQTGAASAFCLSTCIRRLSRRDQEQIRNWCSIRGAKIFEKVQLQDISVSSRNCQGIEISSSGYSGYLPSDEVYCFLSSQELHWMKQSISKKLYKTGAIEAQYNWLRFRFKMSYHPVLHGLPIHWLEVGEIDLPWVGDNFIIINATYDIELFDLWVRVPANQRFRTEYLDQVGHNLYEFLKKTLPSLDVHLHERPQEYLYNYAELGPSPFPVYKEQLQPLNSRIRDWHDCGPENYYGHDKRAMMIYLSNLHKRIKHPEPMVEVNP